MDKITKISEEIIEIEKTIPPVPEKIEVVQISIPELQIELDNLTKVVLDIRQTQNLDELESRINDLQIKIANYQALPVSKLEIK